MKVSSNVKILSFENNLGESIQGDIAFEMHVRSEMFKFCQIIK